MLVKVQISHPGFQNLPLSGLTLPDYSFIPLPASNYSVPNRPVSALFSEQATLLLGFGALFMI